MSIRHVPRLVIADARPNVLEVWREAFRGVDDVEFLAVAAASLRPWAGIDAVLLLGMLAHERFGGMPEDGVSQVLRASEAAFPPWVVTTPPRVRPLPPNGPEWLRGEIEVRPNPGPGEIERDFAEVFRTIRSFNGREAEPAIRVLGVPLELLAVPWGDPVREAAAFRDAYLGSRAQEEDDAR